MTCQQCPNEVIGSPDAKVWIRQVGEKVAFKAFCSAACREAWLQAGYTRVWQLIMEDETLS